LITWQYYAFISTLYILPKYNLYGFCCVIDAFAIKAAGVLLLAKLQD